MSHSLRGPETSFMQNSSCIAYNLAYTKYVVHTVSHDHTFCVGSLLISTDSELAQASTFTGCLCHHDISWYMVDIYQQHYNLT